ncbi:hypothetical protein [Rhodoferax antarcticus]|uniref:hypothetical protein n=1 Tax=Rhodoferax antarcticus TaxID=81479 RepID=UPI00138FAC95|nr:hypothetical protein [Rhodoferax antarcticus]
MNKPITAARKWVLPSAKAPTEPTKKSIVFLASIVSETSEKLKSEQQTEHSLGFSVPSTELELSECLKDPMWRICSGQLYKPSS